MTTETTTQLRRCIGSKPLRHRGPRGADANEFPIQPSQKDGLGRMCKPHWRQYTNALRKAAVARKPRRPPRSSRPWSPSWTLEPAPEVTVSPRHRRPRTRRATTRPSRRPTPRSAPSATRRAPGASPGPSSVRWRPCTTAGVRRQVGAPWRPRRGWGPYPDPGWTNPNRTHAGVR